MASSSRRSRRSGLDIWPGFVDALATLLLVMIFVLLVFVLAQFFLGQALSGRNKALDTLNQRVTELGQLLDIEKKNNETMRASTTRLSTELQSSLAERDSLAQRARQAGLLELKLKEAVGAGVEQERRLSVMQAMKEEAETTSAEQARTLIALHDDVAALEALKAELEKTIREQGRKLGDQEGQLREKDEAFRAEQRIAEETQARLAERARQLLSLQNDVNALEALKSELEKTIREQGEKLGEQGGDLRAERRLSEEARAQAALLSRQLSAVQEEMSRLNAALEASEQRSQEQGVQLVDLGKRLNAALASKVEELSRYRSEFFGRLHQILGDTPGIRVEGDRFVFQSELLFATGSADLGEDGQQQLTQLASTLRDITSRIPPDIRWVLRVDGHTDVRPINTPRFASNWELSAARAISVVKFLARNGISPEHLAATGFGEYQPIDPATGEEAYDRNRRIEFRLDQR